MSRPNGGRSVQLRQSVTLGATPRVRVVTCAYGAGDNNVVLSSQP